ncbi:tRNA threonylcarbamoyladenosine dehydratase [Achromobacter sp. GG226]|uniref:tRNA threonylcarbamoyladenosine dehydratase n=1 Tax=Verticiella alkaliphila TaxID=2779529 RepID=UPI001C0CAA69|nr:tRNA threonylcarbamoyladenosine dehydratase [Verticiella sp. GG226]MBU4611090.1 tRNA threonylcarbamoyladenosine dehydratase [Verticiella sp. GG226]
MQEPASLLSSGTAERRFGGLQRLHGGEANERLARAHVAIAGIGGVGSWTAEALARCGVGALTLIDLDHVAESNINRQVHALEATLGAAKIEAMAERIRQINPDCRLTLVDDFVEPDNVGEVLAGPFTAIVDATDQARAKIAMILHARRHKLPLIVCGGAGGKTDPLALRAGDLSESVNDALLARLRNELRKHHGYPRAAPAAGKAPRRVPRMHVRALWVDEPVRRPALAEPCAVPAVPAVANDLTAPLRAAAAPQGLSCAGYGSIVTVTAAMGLAAAHEALRHVFA